MASSLFPDEPLFISAARAAELLGVTERTIRRAIERGNLRARKFSGVVRIETASIDSWGQPIGGAA